MTQKKFAAFDIDGTIFRWQLYHELFDAFVSANIITSDNAKTVFEARVAWRERKRSYDEYEMTLVGAMNISIVGVATDVVNDIADTILEQKGHHVYRYTSELLRSLKSNGYTIVVISGSHQQLVDRFAKLHNIDIAVGKSYEVKDGKLTAMSEQVFGKKDSILQRIVNENDLSWEDSYAVGDSMSDSAMLKLVANPIAFNPDESLLKEAKQSAWPIVVERKSISYRLEPSRDGTYVLA